MPNSLPVEFPSEMAQIHGFSGLLIAFVVVWASWALVESVCKHAEAVIDSGIVEFPLVRIDESFANDEVGGPRIPGMENDCVDTSDFAVISVKSESLRFGILEE